MAHSSSAHRPVQRSVEGEDVLWSHDGILPAPAFNSSYAPPSPPLRLVGGAGEALPRAGRMPSLSSQSVLIRDCLDGLEEVKRWVKRAASHREKSTLLLHAALNVGVAIDHLANSQAMQGAEDHQPAARTVSRVLVDARRSFDVAAMLARIHGQQDHLTKFFMRSASREKYANATSDLERIADEIWSLEGGGGGVPSSTVAGTHNMLRHGGGNNNLREDDPSSTVLMGGEGGDGDALIRPKLRRTHQRVRRGTEYYSYQSRSHAVGAMCPVAFNKMWWAGKSLNEVNVVTHQQIKIPHASSHIRCMCLDIYDVILSGIGASAPGGADGCWSAAQGGKFLWTGHSDGTVRLWSVAERQLVLPRVACSRTEIINIVCVGDLEVWVGSATGNIRVLSAQVSNKVLGDGSGANPPVLSAVPAAEVTGSTCHGNGMLAERIHLVGTVYGLSSTGSTKRAHAGKVRCMCFSRGRVWSGGRDGILNVWDTATRVRVRSVVCQGCNLGAPVAVSSISGGLTIASAHKCGTVQLWDAATTHQLFSLAKGAVPPSTQALSLCVTDSLLLAGFSDGSLSVWSIHERWGTHTSVAGGGGALINTSPMNLQAHNRPVTCIQEIICESGEREIVTATTRGTIRMWDYGTLLDAVHSRGATLASPENLGVELSGHQINSLPGPKSLEEASSVSVLRDLEGDSEISDLIFSSGLSLGEGDDSDEDVMGGTGGYIGDGGDSDDSEERQTDSSHNFNASLGSSGGGLSPSASLKKQFSLTRAMTPPQSSPSHTPAHLMKFSTNLAMSSGVNVLAVSSRFDDLEIPFDEIELRKTVGYGSFGKVFLATWRHIDVAVKELDRTSSEGNGNGEGTAVATTDFVKEMALMRAFRHPNVVLLYGVCTQPPPLRGFMLVQELCGRGSLFNILQGLQRAPDNAGQRSFSWVRRLSMALDAGVGLFYLHEKGVVHRDLKSPNLLVDKYWRLKVGDFGLAKVIAKADTVEEARRSSSDINSPRWMAPELLQGDSTSSKYGPSADVYSFGHILFEILTLKLPYADLDHSWAVVQAVLDGDRPSFPTFDEMVDLVGDVSVFLSSEDYHAYCVLAKQCWSSDPEGRPPLTEVLTTLRRLLDNTARRGGKVR